MQSSGDNRLPVVPRHVYRAEARIGSDALHIAPNLEWVPDGRLPIIAIRSVPPAMR